MLLLDSGIRVINNLMNGCKGMGALYTFAKGTDMALGKLSTVIRWCANPY